MRFSSLYCKTSVESIKCHESSPAKGSAQGGQRRGLAARHARVSSPATPRQICTVILIRSAVRRVKCDETKPQCFRCTSTGRTCDGYELGASNNLALITTRGALLVSSFDSPKEQRAFYFFRERTSRHLSSFYECDFWGRVILQAAHVHPGIRHAIVALGSFHELFESSGEAELVQDDFALKQYNLAIRKCLENIDAQHNNVHNYVASYMIFICIEVLQGHYASAISLIKGAVHLFYENDLAGHRQSAWPLAIFESLLSRLQVQAIGLVGMTGVGQTIPPRLKEKALTPMPERFSSPKEARDYLEMYTYTHALARPTHEPFPPCLSEFDLFAHLLTKWSSAFDGMLADFGPNLSDRDRRAVNVLKVWRLVMGTAIHMTLNHSPLDDDQTLWDFYRSSNAAIVDLAEAVLCQTPEDKMAHVFTLDFGIVGPLYETARMCRDPFIRRKAIRLLRDYPCREGLWDSLLAARAAERQMELEESAVPFVQKAEDIPERARISTAIPTFHIGERWAVVEFSGQRQAWKGGEVLKFQEIIEW